jgi:isopentenyldiphosphate isomerase
MANEPSTELVDVVDDQGRTVATVTRREMRQRRLPHRCVYVLVFSSRDELFLHLRTATKDVYPGRWDVAVGGVLAAGESFDEAARREAAEELGVEVWPRPLFPCRFEDAVNVIHGMVYRVSHDGPFRLQPEEVVRGEFLPLDQLPGRTAREPFCPDGLAVLAEYQKRIREAGG